MLRALYAVLSHDISSRICDVALNIIDCLLQLGVVPGMGKKLSKTENKENQEARAKDPAGQGLAGGAQGGGAVPGAGGGGDGGSSGGGGGGGSGGGSGQGSKDDVKNNKDNDKKVVSSKKLVTFAPFFHGGCKTAFPCTGRGLQLQHPPPGSDHAHKDSQVAGMRLRLWRGTPRPLWRPPQDAGRPSLLYLRFPSLGNGAVPPRR